MRCAEGRDYCEVRVRGKTKRDGELRRWVSSFVIHSFDIVDYYFLSVDVALLAESRKFLLSFVCVWSVIYFKHNNWYQSPGRGQIEIRSPGQNSGVCESAQNKFLIAPNFLIWQFGSISFWFWQFSLSCNFSAFQIYPRGLFFVMLLLFGRSKMMENNLGAMIMLSATNYAL